MELKITNPKQALSAAMVAGLLSTALHAAPPKYPGQRSLSKVCGVKVPAPIEEATSEYLAPLTAMGGDAKALCTMWQDVNPKDEAALNRWKAVTGAFLMHNVKDQRSLKPYKAALAKLLWNRSAQQLKSVDSTMGALYSDVREHAALGDAGTPKEFAQSLAGRAPAVAKTVQDYYDKFEPND